MTESREELDNRSKLTARTDTIMELFPQIQDRPYVEDLLYRVWNHQNPLIEAIRYLQYGFDCISRAKFNQNSPFSFSGTNEYFLSDYHVFAFKKLCHITPDVPPTYIAECFLENSRLFIPTGIAIMENLDRSGSLPKWKGVPLEPTRTPLPSMPETTNPHLLMDLDIVKDGLATTYYNLYSQQRRILLSYPPPPEEFQPKYQRIVPKYTMKIPPKSYVSVASLTNVEHKFKQETLSDTIASGICPFCYFPLQPNYRTDFEEKNYFDGWVCTTKATQDCHKFGFLVYTEDDSH